MTRIGKCKCGGELHLGVVCVRGEPHAFCTKCFEEYDVEMVGKSRTYQLVKKGVNKDEK